jgi:hypothetical protein
MSSDAREADMSAVCVLTPVVIGNWPVIQAAIVGAMAAMGFSAHTATGALEVDRRNSVEESIENSEVLEEHMTRGERIVATRGDLQVEFGRDQRGACTICVSGDGCSDAQLRKIAREIGAKVVQQYTYHKVITELQSRQFTVADQQVAADGTIKIHVRRTGR